jgi:transcriptional regulator with XRE-family HTH domain
MRPNVRNNLKSVAREAGLSLLEISRETGVSYSMLRRIASGSGDVCLGDAVAVCAVVGCPVERLFELGRPDHDEDGEGAAADEPSSRVFHVDAGLRRTARADTEVM